MAVTNPRDMTLSELGNHFKEAERKWRTQLPAKSIVGMRLDGKSFHTFTRQFARPYDLDFMGAMDATAMGVASHLQGALFGYVQSDEISVFFSDLLGSERAVLEFDGKVEKLVSTSAARATGTFLRHAPNVDGIPIFDSRVFVLDGWDDLQAYVDWRRMDARKNSISMAAHTLYSPRQLHGKTLRERHAMLEGTEHEILPGGFFEGRLIKRAFAGGWGVETATREATSELVEGFRESARVLSQVRR